MLSLSIAVSALITLMAIAAIPASLNGIPSEMAGQAFYEFLFWGSGHILQYTHTLLMMLAWLMLASASGAGISISPRSLLF